MPRVEPPRLTRLAAAGALVCLAGCRGAPAVRIVEVTETIRVAAPPRTSTLKVWVPKTGGSPAQSAELLEVRAPFPYRITQDPEFGNELLFVESSHPGEGAFELTVRYRVARREQKSAGADRPPEPADLAPRGLLVIDDEIRRVAAERTAGLAEPIAKGRALYDYVLERMSYDKSAEGWGQGDSVRACKVGKGNCTDFHSLFMALALASGLPARFRMGYSLPEAKEGRVVGYHCWAEFHAGGAGWIPVDISEAWKNPRRRDFYFGRLDESRVLVSTGREIRLSPGQAGRPLNFLNRPYAEADGRALAGVVFERVYKDVPDRS